MTFAAFSAVSTSLRERIPRVLAVLFVALSLFIQAGCAEMRIRNGSQAHIAAGDYEQGVRLLEQGLKEYPESTQLRGSLIQARAAALTKLLSDAAALRAAGKLDEANALLKRAQALDPQNPRMAALMAELLTERRQEEALVEANAWLAKQRRDMALRVIEQALKDNPRHAGLLSLQRRLELEQRQAQVRASQAVLAEMRPISLDFRDASLRTVLDVVSRNSGINFVIDKDVRSDTRVTVYLRNAKVEDALDLIVSTNQLAKKVIDSKTIVIYPNTADKQKEHQEQVVRVFYLASAEAKGAAAFLKSMLKIRDPFVDERSNMLSLRETPENIQLAERLIALYDAGEPEVLLEVEVMEVSSTRLTDLGIKYPDAFSLTPLSPSGGSDLTLGNIRGLNSDRIALGVSGLIVNLKREVGDFTTLANPKIRARNKEKAKILIGDKIPVISATTGQTGFVADTVSYLDVGIKLDVEPTVYADDEVAIKVALEVSALGSSVKTSSGTLAYQIGTRNASTLLRLRDGETQMLGGLISREDRSKASRVPGAGDLPVLGRLFSSQQDNSLRTELVLAITPHILRNIRHPEANETELWVGTEMAPKLRPVGGLRASVAQDSGAAAAPPAGPAAAAAQPGLAQAGSPEPQKAEGASVSGLKWAAPTEGKVGDVLEFKLALNSSVPLRGLPMEFAFDKSRLQLVEVQEGEYFRQGGTATSFSTSGDGKDGTVRVGVLRNMPSGASGEGLLLTLRLKALAAGVAEVRIAGAQPVGVSAIAPALALPPALSLSIK